MHHYAMHHYCKNEEREFVFIGRFHMAHFKDWVFSYMSRFRGLIKIYDGEKEKAKIANLLENILELQWIEC